jgi:hypothetical protein
LCRCRTKALTTIEPPEASTAEITTPAAPAGNDPWTRSAPPTLEVADSLQSLVDHLCHDLIEPILGGRLPHVMLNLQRRGRAELGHYHPARFTTLDGGAVVGEISVNPRNILDRSPIDVASTVLHELLHCWQQWHGKPPKGHYHNAQFSNIMRACGLQASQTGEPGGRATGQQMDHYIIENGPFVRSWERFVATGKVLSWGDAVPDLGLKKTRGPTRTKFICPGCDLAAWSRASAELACLTCQTSMRPAGGQP